MNLVNEKIKHIVFGEGKVIGQEEGRISIQFNEQYGEKQFIYPDAFEKYLKLYDSNIEMSVMEELCDKRAQIAAEELRKQQYEAEAKSKALENSKLAAHKKKPSKSRVTKEKR